MNPFPMAEETLPEVQSFWTEMSFENSKESLASVASDQPVLLVFLRHFGCSFCREAMSDLSKLKTEMTSKGIRLVFVHMAPEKVTAEKFFKRYSLLPVDHISDPEKQFYRKFGLIRCSPGKLLGFGNFVRGFESGILNGNGFANPSEELGDGFQMPGIFMVYKGEVLSQFIHRFPYDRPNYNEIIEAAGV